MIVMKFGGTSVGSASQIQKVSEIISTHLDRHPIIVVSALSGVTNGLISMMDSAISKGFSDISELYNRHQEVIVALGLPADLLKEEFSELETLFKGIIILK